MLSCYSWFIFSFKNVLPNSYQITPKKLIIISLLISTFSKNCMSSRLSRYFHLSQLRFTQCFFSFWVKWLWSQRYLSVIPIGQPYLLLFHSWGVQNLQTMCLGMRWASLLILPQNATNTTIQFLSEMRIYLLLQTVTSSEAPRKYSIVHSK